MALRFTWNPKKAKRNLQKHGISFSEAQTVFSDPFIIIVEDCEDANGETSYHAIGRSGSQTLLVVVHVDRSTQEEEVVHIISSRKAEDYEQSTYSDQFA